MTCAKSFLLSVLTDWFKKKTNPQEQANKQNTTKNQQQKEKQTNQPQTTVLLWFFEVVVKVFYKHFLSLTLGFNSLRITMFILRLHEIQI